MAESRGMQAVQNHASALSRCWSICGGVAASRRRRSNVDVERHEGLYSAQCLFIVVSQSQRAMLAAWSITDGMGPRGRWDNGDVESGHR